MKTTTAYVCWHQEQLFSFSAIIKFDSSNTPTFFTIPIFCNYSIWFLHNTNILWLFDSFTAPNSVIIPSPHQHSVIIPSQHQHSVWFLHNTNILQVFDSFTTPTFFKYLIPSQHQHSSSIWFLHSTNIQFTTI